MGDKQIGRTVAAAFAALILIGTSLLGGYNAIREWNEPITALQRFVSVGSVVYTVLGFVGGVGVLLRRQWSFSVALAWGVMVTLVGTSAVIAYDREASPLTALSAALMCIAIGGIVAWLVRAGSRRRAIER